MNPKRLRGISALLLPFFILFAAVWLTAATASDDSVLLFTSFRKNGEDGLHLAYSRDGYQWSALRQDQPFLRPKVGGGLMRDPCLIQGPDGAFHLIWTTAWNKHGAGYATSKDLVHWQDESDKVTFPKDHRHGSVLRVSKTILDGLMAEK